MKKIYRYLGCCCWNIVVQHSNDKNEKHRCCWCWSWSKQKGRKKNTINTILQTTKNDLTSNIFHIFYQDHVKLNHALFLETSLQYDNVSLMKSNFAVLKRTYICDLLSLHNVVSCTFDICFYSSNILWKFYLCQCFQSYVWSFPFFSFFFLISYFY